MLLYRAALPLSRATLIYLSGLLRRHRRAICSCWHKLNPGLAGPAGPGSPAQGQDVRLARRRVRVGTSTAWRYVTEAVALLVARAPKVRPALRGPGRRVRLPA
jgi:hypothetical protein